MIMADTTGLLSIGIFTGWLASGSRGISSEAIVSRLTGVPISQRAADRYSYPHDPDDFQRCERLLRAVPLARVCLPTMRGVGPEWAGLVDEWDALADMLEREIPGVYEGRHGSAPETYARMRAIFERSRMA